jgi:Planctomycete cytochrome C
VHNRPPNMRFGISLTSRKPRGVGVLAGFLATALAALAGCGSTDDRPPQWSVIYPAIIEPSCATASCHSDFTKRAGLDLGSKSTAWHQLSDRHFVIPGKPTDSSVLYLLRALGARRMPPDFALPEVDIQLIDQWVIDGAQND